jgi:Uma2 family endonuclease
MPEKPLLVPETKPATEFLDGRFVQKMSPFGLHGRAQLAVAGALRAWAGGRGRKGARHISFDLRASFELVPPRGRND